MMVKSLALLQTNLLDIDVESNTNVWTFAKKLHSAPILCDLLLLFSLLITFKFLSFQTSTNAKNSDHATSDAKIPSVHTNVPAMKVTLSNRTNVLAKP